MEIVWWSSSSLTLLNSGDGPPLTCTFWLMYAPINLAQISRAWMRVSSAGTSRVSSTIPASVKNFVSFESRSGRRKLLTTYSMLAPTPSRTSGALSGMPLSAGLAAVS